MRILRVVALAAVAALPLQVAAAPTAAASGPVITAIAAGRYHSCVLTSTGGVKCWGSNTSGQLGDGTDTNKPTPVDVMGLAPGARSLAVGAGHSCAITATGGVKCWGANTAGQVGDGSTADRFFAVDVPDLTGGVTAIAAGGDHTCAITGVGGVLCWGANGAGELGNATTTNAAVSRPVAVVGLGSPVVAITAGSLDTCALTMSGGVKCWGSNVLGQLGNGTTLNSNVPVDVVGLSSGVTAIAAAGSHTCAIASQGRVKCWGYNSHGQLGDGSTAASTVPVDVAGLGGGVSAIAVGGAHTCAVTTGGAVSCWGYNGYGQLGDTTLTGRLVPVAVSGITGGMTGVTAGHFDSCALRNDGVVVCWGYHAAILESGRRINSSVPVTVDLAAHQTISLAGSKPPGSIARAVPVTFTATVSPVGLPGTRSTVRFLVSRRVNGVWRQATHFDATVGATGRAVFRWSFPIVGSWSIRAQALANTSYPASAPSPPLYYTVR